MDGNKNSSIVDPGDAPQFKYCRDVEDFIKKYKAWLYDKLGYDFRAQIQTTEEAVERMIAPSHTIEEAVERMNPEEWKHTRRIGESDDEFSYRISGKS